MPDFQEQKGSLSMAGKYVNKFSYELPKKMLSMPKYSLMAGGSLENLAICALIFEQFMLIFPVNFQNLAKVK